MLPHGTITDCKARIEVRSKPTVACDRVLEATGVGVETMGELALRIIKIEAKATAARWQPLCAPPSYRHYLVRYWHAVTFQSQAITMLTRPQLPLIRLSAIGTAHPSVFSISVLSRNNANEERHANDCSEEYCRNRFRGHGRAHWTCWTACCSPSDLARWRDYRSARITFPPRFIFTESRLEQGAPLSLLTLYFFAFGLSSRTIDLQQVGVANADAALIITARNWRRKAGQQSAMLAPEGPLS